jgi:tetratricopeptide (TPR) repeat protein
VRLSIVSRQLATTTGVKLRPGLYDHVATRLVRFNTAMESPQAVDEHDPDPSRRPAAETQADESAFGLVGQTPLIFLAFYLDIPLDAGISQGRGFTSVEFGEPALEDWAGFDLQRFLGLPLLPEQAVWPCTELSFYRATTSVPNPFANIFKAQGLQLPTSFSELQDLPPLPESRSVVLARRIAPCTSAEFGGEWLREQFAIVLKTLNAKLLALGTAAEDHTVGPITEAQLPSLVIGFHGDMRNIREGEIRDLKPFRLALHQHRAGGKDYDDAIIKRAITIADGASEDPFSPALEFLYGARRTFDSGNHSHAVIDAGTAIELLVHRVVFGVELMKGAAREQIENLLETGFHNLVRDHLAKHLGVAVQKPYSGSDPLSTWLRVVYKLRNRVAHEGYKPTAQETFDAIDLTRELIGFVAVTAEHNAQLGITFLSYDELETSPVSTDDSATEQDAPSAVLLAREAFRRGVAALEAGDPTTAKEAFAEADENGSPSGAYNYAALCFAEGDETIGIAALRRASELRHPVAPAYLGIKLLNNGNEAEAEKFLLQASTHHPKASALASFTLGVIDNGRGDLHEAAEHYKQAAVFDGFMLAGEAAFRRGSILEKLGDPSAVGAYERGAELGNTKAEVALANLARERQR